MVGLTVRGHHIRCRVYTAYEVTYPRPPVVKKRRWYIRKLQHSCLQASFALYATVNLDHEVGRYTTTHAHLGQAFDQIRMSSSMSRLALNSKLTVMHTALSMQSR